MDQYGDLSNMQRFINLKNGIWEWGHGRVFVGIYPGIRVPGYTTTAMLPTFTSVLEKICSAGGLFQELQELWSALVG